ncbi:MAG: LptF/LptG family permease, partial [Gracilimonas sp.]
KPNTFYDGIDGYTFLVEHIDGETDSLYNITLFQKPEKNQDRAYIVADKGLLVSKGDEALTLHLIHGSSLKFTQGRQNTKTIIERNSFDKHIMNLDLSDLSFMRSDPENRNRSDRTMNSQAMLAVVDSLYKEIDSQTSVVVNSNMIFTGDNFTRGESYFNKDKVLPDSLAYIQAIQSPYHVSNSFSNAEIQRTFAEESIRQVKEYQSKLESIHANIEWREKRIARFLVEVHKKISIPFACVVFILFGAPVGIMTKKGNFGFAALISTIVLTFYWVSLIQGEKLADRLFISPFVGMWTFNIVLTLVGLYLILYLTTDLQFKNPFRKSD